MSKPHPIFVSSSDLSRIEALLGATQDSDSTLNLALKEELDRARILEPDKMPGDVVTMNSTVKFIVEPTGKAFQLTLVYPKDATGERQDVVSILAPIGSALLGLSVGQTIDWPLPGGRTTSVRVVEVVYQPEREGKFHL